MHGLACAAVEVASSSKTSCVTGREENWLGDFSVDGVRYRDSHRPKHLDGYGLRDRHGVWLSNRDMDWMSHRDSHRASHCYGIRPQYSNRDCLRYVHRDRTRNRDRVGSRDRHRDGSVDGYWYWLVHRDGHSLRYGVLLYLSPCSSAITGTTAETSVAITPGPEPISCR